MVKPHFMSFPRECDCRGRGRVGGVECGIHSSFGERIPSFGPCDDGNAAEYAQAWEETIGAGIRLQNDRVYYRAVANLSGWSAKRFNAETAKIARELANAPRPAWMFGRVRESEYLPMAARGVAVNLRLGEAAIANEIRRLVATEYATKLAA